MEVKSGLNYPDKSQEEKEVIKCYLHLKTCTQKEKCSRTCIVYSQSKIYRQLYSSCRLFATVVIFFPLTPWYSTSVNSSVTAKQMQILPQRPSSLDSRYSRCMVLSFIFSLCWSFPFYDWQILVLWSHYNSQCFHFSIFKCILFILTENVGGGQRERGR